MNSYNLIVFSLIFNLIILGLLIFISYRNHNVEKREEKYNLNLDLNNIDPRTIIGGKVIEALKNYYQDINQTIKDENR